MSMCRWEIGFLKMGDEEASGEDSVFSVTRKKRVSVAFVLLVKGGKLLFGS